MLNWCNRFNICCFLDNHNYNLSHHTIECLVAAGSVDQIQCNAGNALEKLQAFSDKNNDWLFGHFGYDMKNEIEHLSSSNVDHIEFPDLFFFIPEIVIELGSTTINIGCEDYNYAELIWREISATSLPPTSATSFTAPIRSRYTKEEYVRLVKQLQQHILRGDCYEINFCQEFFCENVETDALRIYQTLSNSSPNPFSAFYKIGHLFLACHSPERYLKKEGNTILSQPIKGTATRNNSPLVDRQNAEGLQVDEKERAENIMIVDLVRNDLSKVCVQGSVKVEELCAIYSFPQVHQMISTITGELQQGTRWTDIISATFPMGSMTGAPKRRVLELIDRYEVTKRGLFSGSIGYVTPGGDFDFNVVIRSVLYNQENKYLSFHTGSAITFSSDPEKEYEECLLKAAVIKKALAETNTFH